MSTHLYAMALADADAEIDSHLAGRFVLPMSRRPRVLRAIAVDIARFRLHDDRTHEQVSDRYRDAMRLLDLICKGKASLGEPPEGIEPLQYAIRADMVVRFGELELVQLTDRTDTGEIDDTVLQAAIDDACGEIDAMIESRYGLPLASVPAVLRAYACDLSRCRLYTDRVTDQVKTRRKTAVRYLSLVAARKATLGMAQSQTNSYTDATQMADRYGEQELIQLTDRASTGAIDTAVLDAAIADANAEVHAHLDGRYQIEENAVPRFLVNLTSDIARYRLYDDRATEAVTQRYMNAEQYLQDICTRKRALALPAHSSTPIGGPTAEGPEQRITSDTISEFRDE